MYENTGLRDALTGIIDGNGSRYATWTYDAINRGTSSQIGAGSNAEITSVSYDDATGARTVTNSLGVQDTYVFTTLQGVPKVTLISRARTSTTAPATRTFSYDGNGYIASQTDWNGNLTTYVNDIHGDPTIVNEAVGTPEARTTTVQYDPRLPHLPHQIITAGLTTTFTYDASGNLIRRTDTDTTTATEPYSTNGQSRTWSYTWSNFLLASVKSPGDYTTSYVYDSSGALDQSINVTAHTGGGLPLTVVDPNDVTTRLKL